jgi:tetratricopeptide (TPR) repeat protein
MQRAALAVLMIGGVAAWGQAQNGAANTPVQVDRASAYYHYTLAHMYAELASVSQNRAEYINQAIENYKEAIKADPNTPALGEELAEIYIGTGRLRDAEKDADEALQKNPNDVNAMRMLARIYTRQIGDSRQNRIDEGMLRKAIDQYQKITRVAPKDADAWLMLGQLQKVAQNLVESQNAYKKVLEIDPDNQDGLTGLALVYADLGDTKGAADLLKKLSEKNPSARSLRALAATYEQMREYKLAAETLKKVLDLSPTEADELKHEYALDLFQAEQFQDALNVYKELTEAEPTDAQSFLRMSQIYVRLKDYPKARETYEQAHKIEPDSVEIRYHLVNILEAESKTPEAIQLLKDILSSTQQRTYNAQDRGNRITLLERLAALYRVNDQIAPAVDAYRQIADLDKDRAPQVSAAIIETYEIGKDFAKAEQEADAAVAKWPTDRTVRRTRAGLLAEMGKTDAAAADVKKLFDGKDDRDTYLTLADIYEKGKRWNDVAKSLDAAEKLSDSKDEKEGVWFARGAMFEKMNKVSDAEKEFRKVLEGSPKHPAALNYLGYMLADRNLRLPEALQLITRALDEDPNNGAYLDSLGWVQFKMGRYSEAERNLRRAVERTPHDPSVRDHLADALVKQSKLKDAIDQWQISLKEWETSSPSELNPAEVSKVKSKLESAKVRLAKEGGPNSNKQ